ncbi:hypothetical protein [Streptomyces sp. NPDC018833]|uniref:hypothetical protein n=1 Tax=Streptomyces sp. NPDC018833 TaxID=3365053 RepID=UPI00379F5BE5
MDELMGGSFGGVAPDEAFGDEDVPGPDVEEGGFPGGDLGDEGFPGEDFEEEAAAR